ncbi:MAG TPA: c-type cytochrome [Alphaproteobacteria bacterium]|jgi:cytochrome c553
MNSPPPGAHRRTIFVAAAAILLAAAPAWAADLDAAKAKAKQVCAACHGPEGTSQIENTPSLAGQPDQFTQWQLVYFRAGTRKHADMSKIAADLSDADIRNLGAYFATLAPAQSPPPPDSDPALTERGTKIAAQRNCGSCHREKYEGQQAIARLAGQREDYLLKSLRDFKTGTRTGGGVAAMPSTVVGLSDDDLKALAHYLARLR